MPRAEGAPPLELLVPMVETAEDMRFIRDLVESVAADLVSLERARPWALNAVSIPPVDSVAEVLPFLYNLNAFERHARGKKPSAPPQRQGQPPAPQVT